MKPGSVAVYKDNGTLHPRLLELLVQGDYGTKVPSNVTVAISPSNVTPRPANPFELLTPGVKVLPPNGLEVCTTAPVGQGAIALDKTTDYRFLFKLVDGRFSLSKVQHAVAGTALAIKYHC